MPVRGIMKTDPFANTKLYDEIKEVLEENGRSLKDILYVTGIHKTDHKKTLDCQKFLKLARKIKYNSGYGGVEINQRLVVVLRDGSSLNRHEYDGSEWFEYNPVYPTDVQVEDFEKDDVTILL